MPTCSSRPSQTPLRIAYCSLAGHELAVIIPRAHAAREGDRLRLEFPGSAVHLFDRTSGRKLAAPGERIVPTMEAALT